MSKPLTTPRGMAIYPWLERPDVKFDKAGVYRVKLRLEGEEAEVLKAQIDEMMASSLVAAEKSLKVKYSDKPKRLKSKLKKLDLADTPYGEPEDDDDDDIAEGSLEFSFKMRASGIRKDKTKWAVKPLIIDGKGEPVVDKELMIGAGSIIRVSYFMNEFFTELVGAGVSLRLNAVQVIELVPWGAGGGNAEYHGFEAEEGGFDASTVAGKVDDDDEDDDDDPVEYGENDDREDPDEGEDEEEEEEASKDF